MAHAFPSESGVSCVDSAALSSTRTDGKRKHHHFPWVYVDRTKETTQLEISKIMVEHGVPTSVILDYLKDSLRAADAVLALPNAIALIVLFTLMIIFHDTPAPVQAVEQAVDFDIDMNANFAFEAAKGHKNYQDVNSYADFWSWMNLGFAVIYFPQMVGVSESSSVNLGPIGLEEASMYLGQNRKVGPVRLSQSRSAAIQCRDEHFAGAFGVSCDRTASSLDYRMDPTLLDVETATNPLYANSTVWIDYLADVNGDTVKKQLIELEQTKWLGPTTTQATVSFLTYNAHYDVITLTKIEFMFPRSGHIWKMITTNSAVTTSYMNWGEYFVDIAFYTIITVIFLTEAREVFNGLRGGNFKDFLIDYLNIWNFVDWVSIILAYVMLALWIDRCLRVYEVRDIFETYPGRYKSCLTSGNSCAAAHHELFEKVDTIQTAYRQGQAVTGIYPVCIMLRLFKAFSIQPRLAIVTHSLAHAAVDLAHFLIVFLSIYFSYAIMGVALFGGKVRTYSNFGRACFSLFRCLMVDFGFDDLLPEGRGIAVIYIFSYMLLITLLFTNILIAIILGSYEEIHGKNGKCESFWHQFYVVTRRMVLSLMGRYTWIRKVYDRLVKEREAETLSGDIRTYQIDSLVALIPGLSREQAREHLQGALEDFVAKHDLPVEVDLVFAAVRHALAPDIYCEPDFETLTAPPSPSGSPLLRSPTNSPAILGRCRSREALTDRKKDISEGSNNEILIAKQLLLAAQMELSQGGAQYFGHRSEALVELIHSALKLCRAELSVDC